jgi:hypothetical protein
LMCHISCSHGGAVVTEHAKMMLDALERGICSNAECKSLRVFHSFFCHTWKCCAPPRGAERDPGPGGRIRQAFAFSLAELLMLI